MLITRRNFLVGTATVVGTAIVNPSFSQAGEPLIIAPKPTEEPPQILGDIHERIRKQFEDVLESLRFEMNDSFTRHKVVYETVGFLREHKFNWEIYEYRVVCDETNNTPSLIDSNRLRAEVYYKPTLSINYYHILGEAY